MCRVLILYSFYLFFLLLLDSMPNVNLFAGPFPLLLAHGSNPIPIHFKAHLTNPNRPKQACTGHVGPSSPETGRKAFSVTDHQAQGSFSFWPAKLTRMLLFLATAACKTAKPLQLCTPIQLVSMKPPVRSFQPPYERLSSAGLPFPYASGSPTLVQSTWRPSRRDKLAQPCKLLPHGNPATVPYKVSCHLASLLAPSSPA